jgi:hypothetical protein
VYVVCCYGIPFIPSFIYFFIHTHTRGQVYGSATVRPSIEPCTFPSNF